MKKSELFQKGLETGFVTYEELIEIVKNDTFEAREDYFDKLINAGIQIIDGSRHSIDRV